MWHKVRYGKKIIVLYSFNKYKCSILAKQMLQVRTDNSDKINNVSNLYFQKYSSRYIEPVTSTVALKMLNA